MSERREDGMDLWDVTKLLGRRWYVAVPMILLTLVGAFWVVSSVKPDYESTTRVTLLPPQIRNEIPSATDEKVNRWDTNSLTIATVTWLEDKRVHDAMEARGLSDVWEADIDIRFPSLIVIKVTANTEQKARATAQALQEGIKEEVVRQQDGQNLKPGEEVTTVSLDDGSNLEKATSKVKRALIVVVGVGLILTVALTIGLDAFLRWRGNRRRRKAEAAAAGEPPVAAGSSAAAPKAPVDLPSTGKGRANGEPPTIPARNVVPVVVADDDSSRTQVLPRFTAYPLPTETNGADKTKAKQPQPAQQPPPAASPAKPGTDDDASQRGRIWTSTHGGPVQGSATKDDEDLPSDATIVLPLSNGRGWTSKPDKR